MRASVASISKKVISSFFAATLALGLVPAAAFAAPENATIAANETMEEESPNSVISTEASESERSGEIFSEEVIQDDSVADASASASEVDPIEENATTGDDSNLSIPAAMERINEDVALIQPVAQQESTRSYFLAQTLESTKTVPIVSANLPLDKGTSSDVVEPDAEGEGSDSSETEGGEDSDESDLPTSNIIAADSVVIGSFERDGIVYAVEPGGETVAVVATDYNKLPEVFIENQVLVISEVATADSIDYYSVARIADYAFASLTSEAVSARAISAEANVDEQDAENSVENTDEASGIIAISIPASVTSIGDDAFIGADALQFIIVSDNNPNYSMYDGVLYNADQTCLLSIPEGRLGAVRVAPSATEVKPEAFSHCPSVDTLIADPDSAAYQLLEGSGLSDKTLVTSEEKITTAWEQNAEPLTESLTGSQGEDADIIPVTAVDERVSYAATGGMMHANGGTMWSTFSKKDVAYQNHTLITSWKISTDAYTVQAYTNTTLTDTLTVAKRTGYVLKGWWTSQTSGGHVEIGGTVPAGGLTYYAIWCIDHLVNANGGGWTDAATNSNVSGALRVSANWSGEPADFSAYEKYLTRTGYTYKGLALSADATEPLTNYKWPTALTNYFVVWSANTYTITWNMQSHGTAPTKTSYTYGDTYDLPSVSSVTGWTFGGWYTNSACTTAASNITSTTTGNKTFYAKWTRTSYTITWDMKGHGTAPTKTSYTYGDSYTLPSVSNVTGWTFGGWYTNSACTTTASNITSTTTGDKTFYAKWTADSYTITWTTNGHGTAPTKTSYTFGESYTLPTLSETGWTFGGWYTNSTLTTVASNITTTTSGNKTFYAKWTVNTYTISWTINGHGTAPTKTSYTYGESYTLPTLSETGWTFGGWYTNSGLTSAASDITSTTTGNKTFYAKWTVNTYTISWTINGHGTAPTKTSYTYGESYTLPTLSETGWTFGGWYTDSTLRTSASNITTTTTGNKTFYAKWTVNGYTITWNINGHGTAPTKTSYTYGESYTLPTLSETGWTFGGWYTNSGLTSGASNITSTTTGNKTFYAKWTVNTYTITYNMNGHGTAPTSPTSWTYGTATALPNPSAVTGWTFGGWFKEASCTNSASITATTTGNLTVYAKWTVNTYTITYNMNGHGTAPTSPTSWTYGTATALPNPSAVTGWTFGGWFKESACTNAASITATTTGNLTVYAKWTVNTYTITYNMNGHGTAPTSPTSWTYGTATALPSPAAVTGWTFGGWFKEASCTNAASITATTTGNMTVYAKWTRETYTITWEMQGHGTKPTTTSYTYGDTFALPTVANVTGYTFGGWFTNSGCTTSASNITSTTTGNKTFYAKWTVNTYTITWEMQDHGTKPGKTSYTYGDTYALPTVADVTGWKFGGWFTNSGCTTSASNITSTTTGDKTFYAKWTRATYTITWEMQGHGTNQKPNKTSYTFGDTFTLPTLSDDGGWGFGGWFADSACASAAQNITASTTGNKTFYAKWTAKTYTITYNMKDHGTAPTSPTSWKYGTATTLPDPDKVEGWTFGGWFTDNNCTSAASITATTTGNMTVYAKWTLNSHRVYWRYDGGNGGTDREETKSYGDAFTLGSPGTKAGYKFTGWRATGADTNTYAEGASFTMKDGDVTFTATWSSHPYTKVNLSDPYLSEAAAQGAIWYWPERGYVQSETSKEVKTDGIVTPPNLTRLGYKFLGWFDVEAQTENSASHKMIDENGNMVKAGAPSANTDDDAIVWYAHWIREACPVVLAPSYAVNEGEAAFTVVDKENLTSIPRATFGTAFSASYENNGHIPENLLPKRVGYTFMGYYTGKNAELSVADSKDVSKYNGKQWIASDGALSSDNWNEPAEKRMPVTLYAAWRLDECEVTFDVTSNVNASVSEPVTVVSAPAKTTWYYGKPKGAMTVASADTFERHGYMFNGWYYTKDGTLEGEKVFVSDKDGNPVPSNWDVVKTSVTLYPAWTAKEYTVQFDNNFPALDGSDIDGSKAFEPLNISYDSALDLSDYVPTFGDYEFAGWYTTTEQLFSGAHMTNVRFTPRGAVAQQNPIRLHAIWTAPGVKQYHFYVKYPGTNEIIESVHDYYYTDTVKFNGTEAPIAPDGWRFEGWVKRDSDAEARAALTNGTVADDEPTVGGFGPYSKIDRFFVAKWSKRPLSVTFLSEKTDDTSAWLTKADRLKNYTGTVENENAVSWTAACEGKESRPDLASGLCYDVDMAPFVLPDVVRKGQVFKGWRLLSDTDDHAERGLVVDPQDQKTSEAKHDLVYVPVFEDAIYTIILDGNGYGQDQRFENVAYSDTFEFPYPIAERSGAAFVCWAADTNTTSDGTETFDPLEPASVAPVYDEAGETVERFGLAQLDKDDTGIIRLYAVWHAKYNVELPLFANLAIDTERGDVIAGTNTISFTDHEDTDAVYQVESIRYEPMKNVEGENGKYAFEGAADKVYLSVYAGLNTSEEKTDLEHLLYAENIDKDGGTDGEVTYTDASGNVAKAKPLLIELGGDTPVTYGRTAPENQVSLEGVTDTDAPYGFVPFGHANPLTIRYGLYFTNPQTLKDFAGGTKYQWLLPDNDAAYKAGADSVDPESADYGRRTAWSSDAVNIAKLRYTVSVSNTK